MGMKIYSAFVLVLLSCVALNAVQAKNVVDLTSDNFDTLVSRGTWFIKFYAPWCGFCQRLEPTWEEYADISVGTGVNVARVNCDEHRMVCRRFDVSGYPTLKLLVDNKVYDFPEDADREVETFKEFAASGFQKVKAEDVPQGNGIFDAPLAWAESMVVDLIQVYDNNLISGIFVFVLAFFTSMLLSLMLLPGLVGFGPSLFVPRTIYVLHRPGQRPILVDEPQKYKLKTE